ncbi:hypothetical protein P170DRAFT_479172 [Aspergillus steynii IBT 23096]|uniref:Uncharacterized protein n=1 Tax=Aspergillus steynii IBT 23096 TaxID=1392250 RepID=A0A2I2G048_9EURO|nr:uncharacterized protein P170DRAFT_479172 [Aspergillus steynii IBT 23096]PLB46257.1 hypothetical protein P170DRAFT_479172 [Aspergillus steynii IBT 23096]
MKYLQGITSTSLNFPLRSHIVREKATGTPSSQETDTPFPNGLGSDTKLPCPGWYGVWLAEQFKQLPTRCFDIFHINQDTGDEDAHWKVFLVAFSTVAECIVASPSVTIDEIIAQLYDKGLMAEDVPVEQSQDYLHLVRYLVFCALGWQTMLFTPAPLGSLSQPVYHLAMDEREGCCEYTHMSLRQDTRACERESLSEFLMGFGLLLPPKNLCLNDNQEVQRAFNQQLEVDAKTFNAYNLTSIAGLRIKWVDALACHLELNSTTKEISLFRFPSFCEIALSAHESTGQGAIYSCATTSMLRCQWATEEEITHFLLEVLCSYRLLFGQTKRSRSLFRDLDPFTRVSKPSRDPLLNKLCSMRSCPAPGVTEKEMYYLPHDFPILRYRIVILQRHLATAAPRTWVQLWRDNRNSANWLTFWAVIFFGAFGSLMAFLQVLLQLVQMIKGD